MSSQLLHDDLLALDGDTLHSLLMVPGGAHGLAPGVAAAGEGGSPAGGEGSGEASAKRRRGCGIVEATSLDNFLAQFTDCDEADTAAQGVPSEQQGGGTTESGSKSDEDKGKGKQPLTLAARNKACREKARRERLNDGFSELARLVDPGAKNLKTDKASLVVDAIRVITQLRAENNQLRQLNKFLEEKVSDSEKQRQQMMMQQMMMQQQQQQAAAAGQMMPGQMQMPGMAMQMPVSFGMPQGMVAMQPGMAAMSMASMPSGSGFATLPATASAAVPGSSGAGVACGSEMPIMPDAGAGVVGISGMQGAMQMSGVPVSAKMDTSSSGAMPGMFVMGGMPMCSGAPMGMSMGPMPVATPSSWLPPSSLDCSQDHKLRPPAA